MKLSATKLSYEKLHEMLGLADDVHIDDLFLNNDDRYMRTFHLVLSGQNPVIPEHQEGSELATNPLYFYQDIRPLHSMGLPSSERQGFYQSIKRYL